MQTSARERSQTILIETEHKVTLTMNPWGKEDRIMMRLWDGGPEVEVKRVELTSKGDMAFSSARVTYERPIFDKDPTGTKIMMWGELPDEIVLAIARVMRYGR